MARVDDLQTDFSAGELAPQLHLRMDTDLYRRGAARLKNMELLAGGGARRRPGLRYLAEMPATTVQHETWFVEADTAYQLVFYDTALKIYSRTGSVIQTLTGQAWTAAMLGQLICEQDGDTMVITHGDLPTKELTRASDGTFSVANFAFRSNASGAVPKKQPYRKYAAKTVTLQPGAYSGSGVTLTASASVFTSDHVDTIIRYGGGEMLVTGYTNATTLTVTCRETLPKAFSVEVASSLNFLVGEEVRSSYGEGVGIIYSIIDSTHVGVHMKNRSLPFTYDASVPAFLISGDTASQIASAPSAIGTPPASPNWDEQAFSAARGYARACAFHDQRLFLLGTEGAPRAGWASRIGDTHDFLEMQGLADEPFSFDIADKDAGNIKHALGGDELLVFTDRGEHRLPQSDTGTLTAETLSLRKQSSYGIGSVKPRLLDGIPTFVQKEGALVRDLVYDDVAKGYVSASLSARASHLIVTPVDMDVRPAADREEQYLYVVNSDGTIAQLHRLASENVLGWTWWETDGDFKSVRVVDGETFVTVLRNINGTDKLYLERVDYALHLDSALVFASAATASRTVAHLATETVHCVNGTLHYGSATANGSGVATFDFSTTACHVGLNYEFEVKTLRPNIQTGGGSLLAKKMRFGNIWIDLYDSVSFTIGSYTLPVRDVTDDMSDEPSAKTGIYKIGKLGWGRAQQITVEQAYPLQFTIRGLVAEVVI